MLARSDKGRQNDGDASLALTLDFRPFCSFAAMCFPCRFVHAACAETYLGQPVSKAVITCPAYFSQSRALTHQRLGLRVHLLELS